MFPNNLLNTLSNAISLAPREPLTLATAGRYREFYFSEIEPGLAIGSFDILYFKEVEGYGASLDVQNSETYIPTWAAASIQISLSDCGNMDPIELANKFAQALSWIDAHKHLGVVVNC